VSDQLSQISELQSRIDQSSESDEMVDAVEDLELAAADAASEAADFHR
jgi:hypothetical protein